MRVKLKGSAESAAQQSPGWKSMRSGLWNPGLRMGFRLSPPKELKRAAGGMRPVRDAVKIARHEVPGLGV